MKPAIAIKSCHKYAERRQAQLDTWLKYCDTDFFYLIGEPCDAPLKDTLFCRELSDAFENIAPKVLTACFYALQENITNLFVCDDDTYAVYARLMKSGFEKLDYVGHMRTDDIDYNDGVPYAQGSAFWLSERSMNRIVEKKDFGTLLRNGVPDDLAIGKRLIDHVPFTHDWRYTPGPEPLQPSPQNVIITAHKCNPSMMRSIHDVCRNTLTV